MEREVAWVLFPSAFEVRAHHAVDQHVSVFGFGARETAVRFIFPNQQNARHSECCRNGMLEGLYWFYFVGVLLLLGLLKSFGSNSVGMKGDWNIGLINQFRLLLSLAGCSFGIIQSCERQF